MKKKLVAGLLATALAVSSFSTMAMADEPLKMGFIVGSFEHVFYNLIAEGIQEKADELGVEATILDAELDATIASDHRWQCCDRSCLQRRSRLQARHRECGC